MQHVGRLEIAVQQRRAARVEVGTTREDVQQRCEHTCEQHEPYAIVPNDEHTWSIDVWGVLIQAESGMCSRREAGAEAAPACRRRSRRGRHVRGHRRSPRAPREQSAWAVHHDEARTAQDLQSSYTPNVHTGRAGKRGWTEGERAAAVDTSLV